MLLLLTLPVLLWGALLRLIRWFCVEALLLPILSTTHHSWSGCASCWCSGRALGRCSCFLLGPCFGALLVSWGAYCEALLPVTASRDAALLNTPALPWGAAPVVAREMLWGAARVLGRLLRRSSLPQLLGMLLLLILLSCSVVLLLLLLWRCFGTLLVPIRRACCAALVLVTVAWDDVIDDTLPGCALGRCSCCYSDMFSLHVR